MKLWVSGPGIEVYDVLLSVFTSSLLFFSKQRKWGSRQLADWWCAGESTCLCKEIFTLEYTFTVLKVWALMRIGRLEVTKMKSKRERSGLRGHPRGVAATWNIEQSVQNGVSKVLDLILWQTRNGKRGSLDLVALTGCQGAVSVPLSHTAFPRAREVWMTSALPSHPQRGFLLNLPLDFLVFTAVSTYSVTVVAVKVSGYQLLPG